MCSYSYAIFIDAPNILVKMYKYINNQCKLYAIVTSNMVLNNFLASLV
jgi:hypothetical protein